MTTDLYENAIVFFSENVHHFASAISNSVFSIRNSEVEALRTLNNKFLFKSHIFYKSVHHFAPTILNSELLIRNQRPQKHIITAFSLHFNYCRTFGSILSILSHCARGAMWERTFLIPLLLVGTTWNQRTKIELKKAHGGEILVFRF